MTDIRTPVFARRTVAGLIALPIACLLPLSARAQMPGLPVLQNAFANPGITLALDAGGDPDSRAYGGAVAWSPVRRARFT